MLIPEKMSFELAETGDAIAKEEVESFIRILQRDYSVFNFRLIQK